MANSKNLHTVHVQSETHQRLQNLKTNPDETFDSVVSRLLDLEDKYNPLSETYEYEYLLAENRSRLFRVTFSDKISIEYFNRRSFKFEKNIRAWTFPDDLSEQELDLFIRFIIKESNLYVLYEMDNELVQNNIEIRRV